MLLEDLYRDVYSKATNVGLENPIYFYDVIDAINDSIRQLRLQYVKNGQAQQFLETENVSVTKDSTFEELYSGTLSKTPLQDLPSELVFYNVKVYLTDNTLTDSAQSFSKGDLAYREGVLYEATKTSASLNTFDLIFNPKDVRSYKKNNGLTYYVGDIIYDSETEDYYKVNTEYTANENTIASSISEFDVLYWKKREDLWIKPEVIPYKNLSNYTIHGDFYNFISFLDTKLYTNNDVNNIQITYVPAWVDEDDLTVDLDLPDSMITQIKISSLRLLVGNIDEQQE